MVTARVRSCLEQGALGCVAVYEKTPCNARPRCTACYIHSRLSRPTFGRSAAGTRYRLRNIASRALSRVRSPTPGPCDAHNQLESDSLAIKGCGRVEHRCTARKNVTSLHPSRCRRRPRAVVLWRGAQSRQSRTQLVLSSCRSICRAVDAVRPHQRDRSWRLTPRCDGSPDRDESMAGRVDTG